MWRRLISIAFEDVGAAEPDALIDTVALATAADWRAKHGEAQALAWIVQRLADAPKDRSADLLMSAKNLQKIYRKSTEPLVVCTQLFRIIQGFHKR